LQSVNEGKITILGSGLMGSGIALMGALHDHPVTLYDTQEKALAQAIPSIRKNLELMAQSRNDLPETMDIILNRISLTSELKDAVNGAEFIIECVPENMELKQNLFKEIDMMCPLETILCTNTSVMSITEIASKSVNRQRIVGTHFWNPPFLIPLVEIVPTVDTSAIVVERTFNLLVAIGKHPVRVNKDVPGFVANRLQHALWREAISIVERGIADAETVDECVRYGFGLRLPILGPLENSDMVGTDLTFAIHSYILKHLESSSEPSPLLQEMMEDGSLGFKSGSGFFSWTREEISNSREKLVQYLLEQLESR